MDAVLHIDKQVVSWLWPLMRVSGMMLVAPVFASAYIPIKVRGVISLVLAFVMLPHAQETPDVAVLSPAFFVVLARELLIGLAMGFVLRLVIDAAVLAGQTLAISMGLHFATVVDPNHGGTPTVSQFYVIIASLLIVTTDAHLAFVQVVAESFTAMPIASSSFSPEIAYGVVVYAGTMFAGGLQLALPAIAAILMVNVAFGVVSRAAPTLNLFAVGLPITMLVGFLVTLIGIKDIFPVWMETTNQAFLHIAQIVSGG